MTKIKGEKKNQGKITKEEAKDLVEMFRYLMDAYSFFAEKLGNIQKTHKEAFEYMLSPDLAMQIPEMLSEIAEKDPELNRLFTRIFVKMSTYFPQIGNLMNLPAESKIKLGKNLKSLAKDFDELLMWIDKVKEK